MMKKWKMQFSVVLVLLCVVLISAKIRDRGEERKAMHKEMHEYAVENILPVMKAQRLKLEKKLSAEDKATIASVRGQLKTERESKREEMKRLHEQMKNGEMDREEMREHFREMHEAKKEIIAPIKAIAEKHEKHIEKALAVAKENKEAWKEDMEAIRKKYINDEELAKLKEHHRNKRQGMHKQDGEDHEGHGKHFKMRHGKHAKGKMMRGHHMKMMRRVFNPVGFLMWDPNAPMPTFGGAEKSDDKVDVYPNPSTETNKISFVLQQKGIVKIELLDKDGKFVKTILNEVRDSGNHTLDVYLNKLPSAVYYYRITTASGSKTTRFLVNK